MRFFDRDRRTAKMMTTMMPMSTTRPPPKTPPKMAPMPDSSSPVPTAMVL